MSHLILIIDDEKPIRESLKGALSDEGFEVVTCPTGPEGLEWLKNNKPDVVLLDIWMPKMDGMDVLKEIKNKNPKQFVIMMSGHGTIETAVKATKLGAYDFVEKPLNLDRVLILLQNVFLACDLEKQNQVLREQIQKRKTIVGESDCIRKVKQRIELVAPTTGSVLITGENGTGKELIANAIHAKSARFNKPFIDVNCAAIPEELIESELFGHERGAFTGATQSKRGKFDLADGGTLFLDEIGDMSLKTQAKVLRVLQEQKFERVGGSETHSVDVRVIAATNKELREEIQRGTFREDLLYRLNVIRIHAPSLKERGEDIALLSRYFVHESTRLHARQARILTDEALDVLAQYHWPGNVRELRNLIERMIILTPENQEGHNIEASLVLEHLREEYSDFALDEQEFQGNIAEASTSLKEAREHFERQYIQKALKDQGGNISRTADALALDRAWLSKKIKSYGIEF